MIILFREVTFFIHNRCPNESPECNRNPLVENKVQLQNVLVAIYNLLFFGSSIKDEEERARSLA